MCIGYSVANMPSNVWIVVGRGLVYQVDGYSKYSGSGQVCVGMCGHFGYCMLLVHMD